MKRQIYLLFLLFCTILSAQEYQFQVRQVSIKDGLPNNFVRAVMQDRNGFIWMATNYSAVRFDGYQIKEILEDEDLPPISLNEDVHGKIWINHFIKALYANPKQILNIYDPSTDSIIFFDEYYKDIAPFKAADIVAPFKGGNKSIYIITKDYSLYKYDGTFRKLMDLPAWIFDIKYFYDYFNLVSQNDHFIIKTNRENYLWRVSIQGNIEKIIVPEVFDQMMLDGKNALWGLNFKSKRIYREIGNGDFESIKLDVSDHFNDNITWSIDHKQQWIWCATQNYLNVFDFKGKLIGKYGINTNPKFKISYLTLTIDDNGNAWLGSSHGAFIISLIRNKFTNYLDDGIKDIRDILVDDDDKVFVAQGPIHNLSDHTIIINKHAFISFVKKGDTFWGTSYGPYLIKRKLAGKGEFVRTTEDSLKVNINRDLILFSSKKGEVWAGGREFLCIVDTATLDIKPFTKYNNFNALRNTTILSFAEDEDGIWISTADGLYLLDEDKGILDHFVDQFPRKKILHLYKDKDGVFWLATDGGGLLRWDRTSDEVQQFTRKHGLSNDVIYAVYEDDYGYLWLSSQYGLMRFHKQTYQVNIYLPEDGIPHQEFNRLSHAQAPDGRLYFGGLGGVTSFHPKDFVEEKLDSTHLQIIGFEKLNSRNGQNKDYTLDLLENQRIVLHPREKSFRLEFALLNYKSPKDNRYAYRIEGLESEWTYSKENYIRLNGLPYGNFTLHVKAQELNGQWSQHHLYIPVEVLKPIYLRWWFIALSLAMLILLILQMIRQRTKKLQAETVRLEQEVARRTATIEKQAVELQILSEQKSRFFLNVAHDLRTPLTFITTPISLFIEEQGLDERVKKLLESIRKNANHLLGMVESILDLSREDRWPLALEEKAVHFPDLMEHIFSLQEAYANTHHIQYNLHYRGNKHLYLMLDKAKFEKIIQNLLANALKYNSKEGKVDVCVEELQHTIRIQVKDTGIGIHPNDLPHIFERYFQSKQLNMPIQGGSGIGLAIAQEYAQVMQGELTAESRLNEGSTFTFIFPKKIADAPVAEVFGNTLQPLQKAQESSKNGHIKNGRPQLLIVEDNLEMQDLLQQITDPYFEVFLAENGEAALKILQKQSIDCIITDLMMPHMDGLELVTTLKEHSLWQGLPVVMLTARANEQDKLQALRIGIDDYLYKPFSPQELLTRLQNLVKNHKSRKNYQRLEGLAEETLVSAKQQWLERLEKSTMLLLKNNPEFTLLDLADEINLSERHLRRKMKEIVGMSANEYIREVRLQKARQILEQKAMNTISEVSYAVGFSSVSYFTKVFTERFGRKPSEYLL